MPDDRAGITVTGVGHVVGIPDVLRLDMGVEVRAEAVSAALDAANQAAARVIEALHSAGVAAADVKTSGMSIYPWHSERGERVLGYVVSEGLSVQLRDLARSGEVISAAVAAGGDAARVNGIGFVLEDEGPLLVEARRLALGDARGRAQQYATEAGRGLGELVSVIEGGGPPPGPMPRMVALAAESAPGPVPIASGTHDVTVHVTTVWSFR